MIRLVSIVFIRFQVSPWNEGEKEGRAFRYAFPGGAWEQRGREL